MKVSRLLGSRHLNTGKSATAIGSSASHGPPSGYVRTCVVSHNCSRPSISVALSQIVVCNEISSTDAVAFFNMDVKVSTSERYSGISTAMSSARCKMSFGALSPSQGTVSHSREARKVGFRRAIAAVTWNLPVRIDPSMSRRKTYPVESEIDEKRPLKSISMPVRCS